MEVRGKWFVQVNGKLRVVCEINKLLVGAYCGKRERQHEQKAELEPDERGQRSLVLCALDALRPGVCLIVLIMVAAH